MLFWGGVLKIIEKFSLDELIREFDYKRISKSPDVFDIMKLRWMNGEYIKNMDFEIFYEMAEPYLKEVLKKDYDLRKIANIIKARIGTFTDINNLVDFFENVPEYNSELYIHKKMKTTVESSRELLTDILPLLEKHEDYSNDALYSLLLEYIAQGGKEWICDVAYTSSSKLKGNDSG